MTFDPKQLDLFPVKAGVYIMKDAKGNVLYIGKAKQLKNRLKQYFSLSDEREMVPILLAQVAHIDTILVPTEKEALLLENTLIKRNQPKFNVLLKDDKTFISLMVNNKHPWPRIRLVRYKGKPKEEGLYFGPYTSAHAARQTYELLTRIFPLRQCSDEELKRRTRPCLLYGIKRCIAPCVNKCTKVEYHAFVEGAINFLKGKDKEILKELKKEMQKASDDMQFEKAAALLKTIRQIEHVTARDQLTFKSGGKESDVFALHRTADEVIVVQMIFREGKLVGSEHYSFSQVLEEDEELWESFLLQQYKEKKNLPSEILLPISLDKAELISQILFDKYKKRVHILHPQKGEKLSLVNLAKENALAIFNQEKDQVELKEKMLLDLADTLHLSRYPKRIECFDTSHTSGTNLIASMVAYTEGDRDKKRTRLFNIKDIHKGDDYGAMHQVLSRRLIRAKEEEDLPDLVIVDGGKGQLNVAIDVLKELDIATVDVIGVAKEKGRHDKGITAEQIFLRGADKPILLPPQSPMLFLLQKIRDDTHQLAISFHRKQRTKRTLSSGLDTIPGIGEIKRKRLLKHFGSLKRISRATEEELKKIKGLTKKDIQTILRLEGNS